MSHKKEFIPIALLKWYHKAARDLPWRRTKDPYKIWVSEIMLQQTQVDTVIPYYEKWIQRFPTLQHLAKAKLSDVLKYWAGLGYYRRARMLHQAACQIAKNLQGKIPQTPLELMKLPGIGRYTAGAIASIAFGVKTPVLDGNVIRVLTRLFAISEDVGKGETLERLWKIAESLVPEKNPGDFNQALMELGATLCTPENPQCQKCPVSSHCKAHEIKRETHFPVKLRKEKLEKKRTVALILRDNGTVLIQKQPETGRWGGLWTFPFWKDKKSMLQEVEMAATNLKRRLTLHHGFTRYQIQLDVYEYQIKRSCQQPLFAQGLRLQQELQAFCQGPLAVPPSEAVVSPRSNRLSLARSLRHSLTTAADTSTSTNLKTFPYVRRNRISAGGAEVFEMGGSTPGGGAHTEQPPRRPQRNSNLKWVRVKELEKFAFPSPHQKIVKELTENAN